MRLFAATDDVMRYGAGLPGIRPKISLRVGNFSPEPATVMRQADGARQADVPEYKVQGLRLGKIWVCGCDQVKMRIATGFVIGARASCTPCSWPGR
jgi:hypothetical protein